MTKPASTLIGCGCLLILAGIMLPFAVLAVLFIAAAAQAPSGNNLDQPSIERKVEP